MDNSDLYKGLGERRQANAVSVLYFARLREALGAEREQLVLPAGVADVASLRAHLRERGGAWAAELAAGRAVRVAVNQDMAGDDTPVRGGDEVAFFPPVTGG
jgi:molybdopterin synthase sulfur carrier subunit